MFCAWKSTMIGICLLAIAGPNHALTIQGDILGAKMSVLNEVGTAPSLGSSSTNPMTSAPTTNPVVLSWGTAGSEIIFDAASSIFDAAGQVGTTYDPINDRTDIFKLGDLTFKNRRDTIGSELDELLYLFTLTVHLEESLETPQGEPRPLKLDGIWRNVVFTIPLELKLRRNTSDPESAFDLITITETQGESLFPNPGDPDFRNPCSDSNNPDPCTVFGVLEDGDATVPIYGWLGSVNIAGFGAPSNGDVAFVRSSIPSPSTLGLLIIGLAAFGRTSSRTKVADSKFSGDEGKLQNLG
jgi:hypothetical protein